MIKILAIGLTAFLFYLIQQNIYKKMWNRHLYISLVFSPVSIFEGETGEIHEVIENRKRLPLFMLKVKFQTSRYLVFSDTGSIQGLDQYYRNDVFKIGSQEKITRTLLFTAAKRGYYKIKGIDAVSSDLFFVTEMVESRSADSYIYVYPRPYMSEEFRLSLRQLNGEVLTKRHLFEDPFEYRGIREYQPYDDMRSVNWKATAKTEDLMVNQKGYTALKSIRIFFNIEDRGVMRKAECVEASLQIAAGLMEYYLAQGIRVECYGNGRDVINGEPVQVEAGAGSGQKERIYKALARTDAEHPALPFTNIFKQRLMQEAKGTMTYFVSPNAYDDFTELLNEYRAAGQEFIWFYPVWKNDEPELPDELERYVRVLHFEG